MSPAIKAALVVAVCLTGCGPGQANDGAETESLLEKAEDALVVSLPSQAPFTAKGNFRITNSGAANTCAYFDGALVRTSTCNTKTTEIMSVYQDKATSKLLFCQNDRLVKQTQTCRQVDLGTGILTFASCELVDLYADCITTGSGTDVRVYNTLIANNYSTVQQSNRVYYYQSISNGVVRWKNRLSAGKSFELASGKYLKADSGKHLRRDSSGLVSSQTLDAANLGFTWGYK